MFINVDRKTLLYSLFAKHFAFNMNNTATTKYSKYNEDIISELCTFGYTTNDIINAMNHINNKNDINDVIQYITNHQNKLSQQQTNPISSINNTKNSKSESSINSLIQSLPSSGSIKHDPSTSYWYISLGQEWKNESINISKLSHSFIKDTTYYDESIIMAKSWGSMVNTEKPNIQCVNPPSIAGTFISRFHHILSKNMLKTLESGTFCVLSYSFFVCI